MVRIPSLFLVLILLHLPGWSQTPGGVSTGLQVWLKADAGVEEAPGDPAEDGDAISRWLDNSGMGLHYPSVAGPTFRDNTINFNPVVEILSGGFDAPAGSELSTDWTAFFVSRKLASDNDGRVFDGHTGNYLWAHWGTYTNSIYLSGNPNNFNSGIATTSGIENLHLHTYRRESTGGTLEARADGTSLTTFGSSNSASGIRIDIEQGSFSGESSDAQIGDMIIYNAALTATDVNKVESYLAIKYGMTVTHNYLASDGTVLWNATTNATYHNAVAGIGRDDASALDQQKSLSISTDAAITLDKGGAFGSDLDFIVWGNDNGMGTSNNTPGGFNFRTTRVWKVAVTGTPGAVIFSANLLTLGLPNTGNASDYALLLDTDSDFSSGASTYTAGASLVGDVLSFTGLSFSDGQLFTIAAANVATPGGVAGNMRIWLKADAGVEEAPGDPAEDGDPITQWVDQSGSGNHYATVAGPTWQDNAINFNPAVEILSGGFDAPAGSELSTDWTAFFVSRKLASDNDGRVFDGHTGNYLWAHWGTYTNSIYLSGNPNNFNSGIATTSGIENLHLHTYRRESTGGTLEARADGTSLTTFGSSNSASGIRIDIEQGSFSGESSDAQIGDMIIYNAALTATDVNKVESYLAIKYGMTVTHNYLASDGTVLWNATTNATYHNAVAGIGRDDASALDQQKSKSINANTALTVDKGGAFGADKDFLLWGNDNNTGTNTNVPSGYALRSARTWKAAVTGTPGNVTVSVDLSVLGMPNTGSASDYALLIDTDADFTAGASAHITGASLVGSTLSFTSVSLADGNFFSFAVTNVSIPGGIAGAVLWVKADAGVTGTTNVSNWADQTGLGNDVFQGTGSQQPSLVSNSFNFNPAIDFSDPNDIFQITAPPANLNSTIFAVAAPRINSTYRTMFRGTTTDHPIIINSGTDALGYYDNDNVGFKTSGLTWLQDEPAVVALEMRTNDVNFRKNGAQGASITTINLSGPTLDYYGNYQGGNQRFGKIAETIIFSTTSALTTFEKEKIESYLATKYGITLTNDYVASDGTVLWDATTNAAYHNDVAGIGRDDATGLSQQKSLSVDSDGAVTLDNGGAFSSDLDFIYWGNNNVTGVSPNAPSSFVERAGRIWKVATSGTPGAVAFSIDLAVLGLPNTGSASDYALLIDTDTDFSTGATEHTTGASLVGSSLSFTGVIFANNDYFSIAAMNVSVAGGVSGAVFWVKADVGVTGTTNISNWADQSGNSNDATQATMANQPALVANDLNFNPSVNFSVSAHIMTPTVPPANLNATIFVVGKPNASTNWRTLFRGSANDHPIIVENGTTTFGYYDNGGGNFKSSGFTWIQGEPAIVALEMRTGDVNFRKNGTQGASNATIGLGGLNLNYFGNYQGGGQPFGKVEEAIIFSTGTALTSAEKQQIESYLAVKYGITISHNYLAGDGSTVWDATANASYHNDVAGIGKDSYEGLNQKQSFSQNSTSVVTVGLGTIAADNASNGNTFGADKSYFVWGRNTGAMNSTGTGFIDVGMTVNGETVVARLNRVWKAAETGTVGSLRVRFNLSTVPGPSGPGDNDLANVRLLVDADGTFATGATSIPPTTFNNGTDIVEFDHDFAAGTGFYFTIGSVDYTTTPLPIELLSFEVALIQKGVALVSWTTASEFNNDHFDVERSANGEVWKPVGSVRGAGTSAQSLYYSLLDRDLLPGLSFYRLRQTDVDGRETISKVVTLNADDKGHERILLYPNPARDEITIICPDPANTRVIITNSLGQEMPLNLGRGTTEITIQTIDYPRGTYIVSLQQGALRMRRKVILE